MRIHIEVVTEGQPGRQRIATVERIVEQAPCDGIGLSLEGEWPKSGAEMALDQAARK